MTERVIVVTGAGSGIGRSIATGLLDAGHHVVLTGGTQIDIGNAATAMTEGIGHSARQPDGSLRAEPTFDPRYVADAVTRLVELPLDVTVPTMTIMATGMPYIGRG